MSILNDTGDGYCEILIALCEFLINQQTEIKTQDVINLFSQGDKGKTSDKPVYQTLKRWTDLELFDSGENFRFSNFIKNEFVNLNKQQIPSLIRYIIFNKKNNPVEKFWQDGNSETGLMAGDFTRACTWILAQEEIITFSNFDEIYNISRNQLKNKNFKLVSRNSSRFIPMVKYMYYLGFISLGFSQNNENEKYIIDPSNAVEQELDYIFGNNIKLSDTEFIDKISKRLPVMDNSYYRLEIEKQLNEKWKKPKSGSISSSLSKAMDKLEKKKLIKFNRLSDRTSSSFSTYRDGFEFNSVERIIHNGTG